MDRIYGGVLDNLQDKEEINVSFGIQSGYKVEELIPKNFAHIVFSFMTVFPQNPPLTLSNIYSTSKFGRRSYVGRLKALPAYPQIQSRIGEAIVIATPNPVYGNNVHSLVVNSGFHPFATGMILLPPEAYRPHIHVGGILHFKQTSEGMFFDIVTRGVMMEYETITRMRMFAELYENLIRMAGRTLSPGFEERLTAVHALGKFTPDFSRDFHREVVLNSNLIRELTIDATLEDLEDPYQYLGMHGALPLQKKLCKQYGKFLQNALRG